jgi:hypothetical protein
MEHFKSDNRRIFNIELPPLHRTHKRLVGEDSHHVLTQNAVREVDGLPVGHIGNIKVWHPDLIGRSLDHVDAAPEQRVPAQVGVQPAGHQVAIELRLLELVVHFDHVFDGERHVDEGGVDVVGR